MPWSALTWFILLITRGECWGVSVGWGCLPEEQLSGIQQECCCFSEYLDEPSASCPSLPCTAKASSTWSRAEEPKHCCSLFFPAPLHGPAASRVRRAGLSEGGSALLLWKVAQCRGHPAVTAVTIHTSAFPHSWGEWPSLAVTVGDFSLLQSPTVTVKLQISQGGLGWVLL